MAEVVLLAIVEVVVKILLLGLCLILLRRRASKEEASLGAAEMHTVTASGMCLQTVSVHFLHSPLHGMRQGGCNYWTEP
ncbi:sialic acid-binding Ig-like lectin 13 isoform X2 [Octodon degus]|uniref:Sialic acid-binding Ig-like lectin 13 isoform X2 n=1 Tax=Octodon degus TaxID=10160 RepID=A0A6P6DLS1_OCTDE|nr:sialic acid-binding Ig-like lectin 13 isoform X2 [Octodon degus]